MKIRIEEPEGMPVRVVRVHKPRGGGSGLLGEFSNHDGRGVEEAKRYARRKRHVVVEVVKFASHSGDRPAA